MKRISFVVALTLIAPNAMANEIAGTRVSGQGAVCAEGQGKALEMNATTHEEWSYCYEREPISVPTQQQLEERARQVIAERITQQRNAEPETTVNENTVTAEPEIITETLIKVEVNATTGVVTVSEFTETEKQQLSKDRAVDTARRNARTEAETASRNTVGVRQCVNWQAEGNTGTECAFEPIPATQEEVNQQVDELKELFNINWFAVLLAWLW
jgi:hypothetical protein